MSPPARPSAPCPARRTVLATAAAFAALAGPAAGAAAAEDLPHVPTASIHDASWDTINYSNVPQTFVVMATDDVPEHQQALTCEIRVDDGRAPLPLSNCLWRQEVDLTFPRPGTYDVEFVVTDPGGQAVSDYAVIEIIPNPSDPDDPEPWYVTPWLLTSGFTGAWGEYVTSFSFGPGTEDVRFGDWDGDGIDTPAYVLGTSLVVRNTNEAGDPDQVVDLPAPAGATVVTGDWDGDGRDTAGWRDGNRFVAPDGGRGAPADFWYGRPDDEVLVGDWDGDGRDTIAVRRGNAIHVRNSLTSGNADFVLWYGKPGEPLIVADIDGDGIDTLAVRRGDLIHVRTTLTSGNADFVAVLSYPDHRYLAGDIDGDGVDTLVGVRVDQWP